MTVNNQNAPQIQGVAFPTNRAFVVQFQNVLSGRGSLIAGRVEHLLSGRRERFHSWKELRQFILRELSQLENAVVHTDPEDTEDKYADHAALEYSYTDRTRAPPESTRVRPLIPGEQSETRNPGRKTGFPLSRE